MNRRIIKGMLLTLLALAILMIQAPALAAGVEAPVILLNGEAVTQATMNLSLTNQLAFTSNQPVTWTSSKTYRATVDPTGVVTSRSAGTIVLTATAADGRAAHCEVRMSRLATGLTITGPDSLAAGKSGTLKAVVSPANVGKKTVTWSSSDPAVISVNNRGRVSAARVNDIRTVVITATAADGSGVTAQHTVTVRPAVNSVEILRDNAPVQEVFLNLTGEAAASLSARVLPGDAGQGVTWKSSKSSVIAVDGAGNIRALKPGTATVTAAATDGSGRKAVVKVRAVRMVTGISVTGAGSVTAGKSVRLSAGVMPTNATVRTLNWTSSDPSVATVNRYGSVTAAKNVSGVRTVVITAAATDGSGVSASHTVTVTPRISGVQQFADGKEIIPKNKLVIDVASPGVQLEVKAAPADACQSFTWRSSSNKRAMVDANGKVHPVATGTVTITATATDGSGVKATFRIAVGRMVRGISVTGDTQISSGKSGKAKAALNPANATERGVTWESSNPAALAVIRNGELRAGRVDVPTEVTITAVAKDGSGVRGSMTVTVQPVAQAIGIRRTDANMASGLVLNPGARANLQATVYPVGANQGVTWTSSKPKVASVDANGVVTAISNGITTLTARARDGSGVRATLMVGVGNTAALPYYFEVDKGNQVVRVYERGDGTYSHLIKRMICSSGRNYDVPADTMYAMHGGRMVWMDGVAIYATRIVSCYLFHSVIYTAPRMDALDASAYNKLGRAVSGGCIRLLAGDAKWIYDNVPAGCFVNLMRCGRTESEYGAVSLPPLKSGRWDPTNPEPGNPDFDPTYTSNVK